MHNEIKSVSGGKKIILALAALVIGILILSACTNNSNSNGSVSGTSTQAPKITGDLIKNGYFKGPKEAKVTIVEFSDFQCPACKYAHEQIKEVLGKYPNDIKFVFRHFPLSFHQFAKEGAQSAEAAGLQGKFWEMYDKIFDNQNSLSSQKYIDLAGGIGLDVNKFKTDKDSEAIKKKVEDDLNDATNLQLAGTPTFFINGELYSQNFDAASLEAQVKKIIDK